MLVFCLFWGSASVLQFRAHAFQSEFGSDPDEPAHYVTGLMVRDYALSGFSKRPLEYARDYYVHYPKVALGHWPPFFYLVQAVWTLAFAPSRTAVMLLMGAITALLATLLCETVRQEMSFGFGAGVSALFVSLPVVERFGSTVMSEMLLGLLVFLALLSYGRYLDTEHWQPAACFGAWSVLAILTKGTAIQLALVPPFALLLTRRWHLLRRFSFWLPGIIVVGLAAPWYLRIPGAQHELVAHFGGIEWRPERLTGTLVTWVDMAGVLPAAAAVLGLTIYAARLRRGETSGKWIAGSAVLLGTYLIRLIIGAFEDRQLMVDVTVLLMFAADAIRWLLSRSYLRIWWLAALSVVILIGFNVKASPIKHHYGFSEVADNLLQHPEFRDSIILVCSNATGEGMMISEIAMRELRPGHIVLRGSKMLATSDWMGWDYRLLFRDTEEMFQYLDGIPVGVVVIDGEGRQTPHGRMLYEAVHEHPGNWELVPWQSDKTGAGADDILIYRLVGQEQRKPRKIQIPMRSGLYGDFETQF
jgi:hypothetical protein